MKLSVRCQAAKGFLSKPSGCCLHRSLKGPVSPVLFFSLIAGHVSFLTLLAYFLQNAYGILSPSATPVSRPDHAKNSLETEFVARTLARVCSRILCH